MKIIMVDPKEEEEEGKKKGGGGKNTRRFHNINITALMFLYPVKYTYVCIYVTGLKQEYLKQYMNCGKEFQLVGVR